MDHFYLEVDKHINLDQYFCFHTMKERDVPDCHLASTNLVKLQELKGTDQTPTSSPPQKYM